MTVVILILALITLSLAIAFLVRNTEENYLWAALTNAIALAVFVNEARMMGSVSGNTLLLISLDILTVLFGSYCYYVIRLKDKVAESIESERSR